MTTQRNAKAARKNKEPGGIQWTISLSGALLAALCAGGAGGAIALLAMHLATPHEKAPAPIVTLACNDRTKTGYATAIPVVAHLDEHAPTLTFANTVYHLPGAANRPVHIFGAGATYTEAIVFADAAQGHIHALETGAGDKRRALQLTFDSVATDTYSGRLRLTIIEKIASAASPEPERQLPLTDWTGLPPADWVDDAAASGKRLVRITEGYAEWLECDPLPPEQRQATLSAFLAHRNRTARSKK